MHASCTDVCTSVCSLSYTSAAGQWNPFEKFCVLVMLMQISSLIDCNLGLPQGKQNTWTELAKWRTSTLFYKAVPHNHMRRKHKHSIFEGFDTSLFLMQEEITFLKSETKHYTWTTLKVEVDVGLLLDKELHVQVNLICFLWTGDNWVSSWQLKLKVNVIFFLVHGPLCQ